MTPQPPDIGVAYTELVQAVREFLELPVTSTKRRMAELVGVDMIEPSEPGSYKQARGVYLTIENDSPLKPYYDAISWCAEHEEPLQGGRCYSCDSTDVTFEWCDCASEQDTDSGFCTACADGK